ncbi:MAG TPA: ABC transporter ATP-binding protein [Anaerolineales bacterium]|nr:ABC transporter ATP-binding protein [Anaerolineales bacterium]
MKPVIVLNNISVQYRTPEEVIGTFKEYAIQLLKRNVRFREFKALDNVDLQVYEGEILGIIGRNGAGKSTLLKVISRVLIPSAGRVRIRGHVSPLLELGAGFHPELTGRENVYLNGTLLGHTRREIDKRLPEIIEFAELGAFIDSPLRTYSSGMAARLGFSVATAWQPEILILDEILSVGDEGFRQKCQIRMQKYRDLGTTTLLVTHDSTTVETLCSRAVWLDHGQIKGIGPSREVVSMYRQSQ